MIAARIEQATPVWVVRIVEHRVVGVGDQARVTGRHDLHGRAGKDQQRPEDDVILALPQVAVGMTVKLTDQITRAANEALPYQWVTHEPPL